MQLAVFQESDLPRGSINGRPRGIPIPLCAIRATVAWFCRTFDRAGGTIAWFQEGTKNMENSVNVLALVKDDERYVFLYDENSVPQLLQMLGRYAADPELTFSWYDAAVLSQKVRRLARNSAPEEPRYRESA